MNVKPAIANKETTKLDIDPIILASPVFGFSLSLGSLALEPSPLGLFVLFSFGLLSLPIFCSLSVERLLSLSTLGLLLSPLSGLLVSIVGLLASMLGLLSIT